MAISSLTSTAPTPTYTTSTPTTTTSSPDTTTSVTLSTLSQEASIVATLGSSASTFQPYDATGLLNLVNQANTAAIGPSPGQDAATSATSSPASATSVAAAVPGDWGTILKTNPTLTSVAVADAVAQGIVNTIDVYA
jgi:hypothetical protein